MVTFFSCPWTFDRAFWRRFRPVPNSDAGGEVGGGLAPGVLTALAWCGSDDAGLSS